WMPTMGYSDEHRRNMELARAARSVFTEESLGSFLTRLERAMERVQVRLGDTIQHAVGWAFLLVSAPQADSDDTVPEKELRMTIQTAILADGVFNDQAAAIPAVLALVAGKIRASRQFDCAAATDLSEINNRELKDWGVPVEAKLLR